MNPCNGILTLNPFRVHSDFKEVPEMRRLFAVEVFGVEQQSSGVSVGFEGFEDSEPQPLLSSKSSKSCSASPKP